MFKTLPIENNFLGIDDTHCSFDTSRIAIISAPYEHTVSYGGGTRLGPAEIIEASHYVEFFDEECNRELCFDLGIATLEPLDLGSLHDADMLDALYHHLGGVLDHGKFAVTLGGEHTISVAPIRAHLDRHPGMSVLQFDAHSDLRVEYLGNRYSHASAMARALEYLAPESLVQVGIRAQCKEEHEQIRRSGIRTFYAHEIRSGAYGTEWQQRIADALAPEVYITFDVDYFDPAIMATTGTPEPGGFFWDETMRLLRLVGEKHQIVGCDVVELAADRNSIPPTYLTAKLVYKLLNYAFLKA